MSIINICDVSELVENKEFVKIKEICKINDICVKYDNPKKLYLLANVNENQNKFKKNKNILESEGKDEVKEESKSNIELSEDEKNIKNIDRFKKQANGIIMEQDTNKIVAMCQNKLQDLNSLDELYDLINTNINSKIRLEYCEDGTMIRLYNHNNIWYTATTRCIDAKISYWTSNKNFDELFWEIFDKSLLYSLDKNYTYVFILLHKENRIVIKHNVNMLVYISRINNISLEEDYTNVFNNIYGIKRPKKIELNNLSEAFYNPFKRGIIVKILDKRINEWNLYKLDFDQYRSIKTIRGNVPDLRMRFLELLNSQNDIKMLEMFYSENKYMFNVIKVSILKLIKEIHKLYIESHIKHSIEVKEGNVFYRTLKQLHAQYKLTNKPISIEDVQNKIYSLDKNIIKKFLNWS
jgi:hypothetical protein